MEKRPLGRTGLEVSIMGLGGHLFPVEAVDYYQSFYGRRVLELEAMETRLPVIEAALTAGINLFAADFDYEVRALGQGLRHFSARDRAVVTAVVDFRLEPDQNVKWAELESSVDHLLTMLESERLELPQIRVSNWYAQCGVLEDLVGVCQDLTLQGKISVPAFYSSDHDLEVLVHGLDKGWFQVVCRALGILNPTAGRDLLPLVASAQAGFIGFIPFQKGWLFDCGREAGLSDRETARAGLGWAWQHTGVTSMLCGSSGPGEVTQNARSAPVSGHRLDWRAALTKLTATEAYDRFIRNITESAPELAFDWRRTGVA
jgi:aryl-alcohol dehydrogenase-like predicted oxidoreductase